METPPLPPEPLPLTEPPPPDRNSGGMVALRAIGGFVAYLLVGGLAVRTQSIFILPPALIVFAIVTAVKGTARGFALGVFIGVGLTLLALGVCFAIMGNLRF